MATSLEILVNRLTDLRGRMQHEDCRDLLTEELDRLKERDVSVRALHPANAHRFSRLELPHVFRPPDDALNPDWDLVSNPDE